MISVNQVGFEPNAPKGFSVSGADGGSFTVEAMGPDVKWHPVFDGILSAPAADGLRTGDFSAVTECADYRIRCGREVSRPFVVKPFVHSGVERMMLSYFRWQRCGSKKGWAGLCHQDPVPLRGTDRRLDLRGGYHQSGDLRGWADGISMSVYSLLRWAGLRTPFWDSGEIEEELRWGIDYFLKLVGDEGFAYDCQFLPIGWGARDYYASPANLGAQCNILMLLARAAQRFRTSDPTYADRCLATALRMVPVLENDPRLEPPYKPPVPLEPGCQDESFYAQTYRRSATGLSGLAMGMLELYRATGDETWAERAKAYGHRLVALQWTDGPLRGLYRLDETRKDTAFGDCSYNHSVHGERVPFELFREFGGAEWRDAALRTCECDLRMHEEDRDRAIAQIIARENGTLPAGDPLHGASVPAIVRHGTSAFPALSRAIRLNEGAIQFGHEDFRAAAQDYLDWIFGRNPRGACYVTGPGYGNERSNVWGQFFPSTPAIPGGVSHVMDGEYDMPAVGLALWAFAEAAVAAGSDPALEAASRVSWRFGEFAG